MHGYHHTKISVIPDDRSESAFLFEPAQGVDLNSQKLCNVKLGLDPLDIVGWRIDQSQIEVLSAFRHHEWIAEFYERNVQFVGHVLFGFLDSCLLYTSPSPRD